MTESAGESGEGADEPGDALEPPIAGHGITSFAAWKPSCSPFAERASYAEEAAQEDQEDCVLEVLEEEGTGGEGGTHSKPPPWSVVFRAVWSWDLLAISIVYFVEGIMDMNLLAIAYFIKDELHLGPTEAGMAQAAASLPWEVTPLLGLLTDSVSVFGYHRKAYLMIIGVVGCLCWLLLPLCTHVVSAVGLIATANVCTAWSQVIADAVMVRMCQGREQDVASFYQSLSWTTYTAGALVSALVGGLLIDSSGPTVVFKLGAAGLLLDAACALLITERRQSSMQRKGSVLLLGAGSGAATPPLAGARTPRGGGGSAAAAAAAAANGGGWGASLRCSPCGSVCPATPKSPKSRSRAVSTNGCSGGEHPAVAPATPPPSAGTPPTAFRVRVLERVWKASVQADGSRVPSSSLALDGLLDPLLDRASGSLVTASSLAGGPQLGGDGGGGGSAVVVLAANPLDFSYFRTALQLLRMVFSTIALPHIFVPALFVFLWQASPSPYNAMFYFQTNVLNFSAEFLELVQLCGYLSGFAGLAFYQLFLVNRPMRSMLLGCALTGTLLNATQLILVTRLNLRLGIPDKVFVLGDYTMMSVLSEVMMTPLMAVAARTCPEGAEATMYSTMYMILNWSNALATALGAGLTRAFGVTADNFEGMPWLMLASNLAMLLPLPVLLFMPGNGASFGAHAAAASVAPAPSASGAFKRVGSRGSLGVDSDAGSGAAGSGGGAAGGKASIAMALSVRRLVPLTPVVSWAQIALPDGLEDGCGSEEDGGGCSEPELADDEAVQDVEGGVRCPLLPALAPGAL